MIVMTKRSSLLTHLAASAVAPAFSSEPHLLLALWNAAHVRVVLNGEWRDTIGELDYADHGDLLFGHQGDEKCGLRVDWHPWPSKDAPILQELAASGTFRVCAVGGQDFWPIGLNTTTPEPTGEIVEYTAAVVRQMAAGLEQDLTLQWAYAEDSTECLSKLAAGEVEMYGPADGLGDTTFGDAELLRAFEPSCAYFEQNDMYAVRLATNWTTFMDMHNAARRILESGQTPQVVTGGWIGDTFLNIEREFWPEGTEVLDATPFSQETMLSALKDGSFLAVRAARIPGAFVGPAREALAQHGLRVIFGQIASRDLALFRRQPISPDGTTSQDHERHDLVTAWNAAQRALLYDGSWRDLVGESGQHDLWGTTTIRRVALLLPGQKVGPLNPSHSRCMASWHVEHCALHTEATGEDPK